MGILEGKVAIITGAASGIGRAQATIFVQEGAKVVLTDMNFDGVNSLSATLSPNGENTLAVKVNVLNQKDIMNMVEKTINKFGHIDILCNTAGAFDEMAPILKTSEELWDRIMNINTKGLYLVTKAILPLLIKSGKGNIINISSGAGLAGGGGGIAYTTSKHAVIGFTRQIAVDYKAKGIRANAICPGVIETPMTKQLTSIPSVVDKITQSSGRLGRPEDIAKATLFLASDLSDYINGVEIPVDGGLINTI